MLGHRSRASGQTRGVDTALGERRNGRRPEPEARDRYVLQRHPVAME